MRKLALVVAALTAMAIALVPSATSAGPRHRAVSGSDVRPDVKVDGKLVVPDRAEREITRVQEARRGDGALAPPVVGEERIWLGYDDVSGTIFPKLYTLRGIGDHIEVWVASDKD